MSSNTIIDTYLKLKSDNLVNNSKKIKRNTDKINDLYEVLASGDKKLIMSMDNIMHGGAGKGDITNSQQQPVSTPSKTQPVATSSTTPPKPQQPVSTPSKTQPVATSSTTPPKPQQPVSTPSKTQPVATSSTTPQQQPKPVSTLNASAAPFVATSSTTPQQPKQVSTLNASAAPFVATSSTTPQQPKPVSTLNASAAPFVATSSTTPQQPQQLVGTPSKPAEAVTIDEIVVKTSNNDKKIDDLKNKLSDVIKTMDPLKSAEGFRQKLTESLGVDSNLQLSKLKAGLNKLTPVIQFETYNTKLDEINTTLSEIKKLVNLS